MTIIERIEALLNEGLDLKKVRAYLVIEDYKNVDIEAAIKELGLSTKAKKGFAAEYYDWLAGSARTKTEAEDFIAGTGEYGETTPNIKKHKSHYLNIWDLTARVWAGQGAGEEPSGEDSAEESADEVNPKVQAAWDKLTKAKAAWAKGKAPRSKGAFHPDKVSHLGDEGLTTAYTKFFQDLNG